MGELHGGKSYCWTPTRDNNLALRNAVRGRENAHKNTVKRETGMQKLVVTAQQGLLSVQACCKMQPRRKRNARGVVAYTGRHATAKTCTT